MSGGSREDAEASARDLLHLSETGSDHSNSPEPGTVNSSLSQKRKRSGKAVKGDDKSTVAKKQTSSVVKESKRLLTVLASLVCPDATRPKLASIMTAAIAEIRRIDPVASAAVKAFKPSKVVEEDTATYVGKAKSDGAASKKPSQSSRTPYIRSWRKNNRGLESELRCLLSIRSPLVPKSKEALYTYAIERIEASRRAQPIQDNGKSKKVNLAHQLSASTLQSRPRIGGGLPQSTKVHK